MNKSLALLGIGLILGGLTGFVFAAGNGITLDGHDHSHDFESPTAIASVGRDQHTAHNHGTHGTLLPIPEGAEAPTRELAGAAELASGWNLHIRTKNFRFAPENASKAHVPGEGHAHVYVNGTKIARHYGAWLHIPELPQGRSVITVTLNANDHRFLGVGMTPLQAEQIVLVN